jgi:hypothetical protein
MTEAEAREFWQTHEITEEYIAAAGPVSDDDLPPVRPSKYVALHLKRDFFQRIKQLARLRDLKVEELLEQLVEQGLTDDAARKPQASRRSG